MLTAVPGIGNEGYDNVVEKCDAESQQEVCQQQELHVLNPLQREK